MKTRQWIAAAGGLIAVVVVACWWFGGIGPDPEVVELQQMRDTVFSAEEMSGDQRRATWEQMRSRIDNLSESQRRDFFRGGRAAMQSRMAARLDSFFNLPPAEQRRSIREQAGQIIARRQDPERGGRGGRGGPGGRGGEARDGTGGGRPGGWGNSTDAERDARRKGRLDRTNPKIRAQFTEYRRMLNQELEARGEEPSHGPPRFGGPGGPGRRNDRS